MPICTKPHNLTLTKFSSLWPYRDGSDPDGLYGGVGEQVPEAGPHLWGGQVLGGAGVGGGDVLYGFGSHMVNYGVILWGVHTNKHFRINYIHCWAYGKQVDLINWNDGMDN